MFIHLHVAEYPYRATSALHYEFDEKIDRAIQKSLRATLRLFKDRRLKAVEANEPHPPPSQEEFVRVLDGFIRSNKEVHLKKLRVPSLQTLFERAWAQNLRSYATQRLLHESYAALARRY